MPAEIPIGRSYDLDPKYIKKGQEARKRWRKEQAARERRLGASFIEVTDQLITPEIILGNLQALQDPAPTSTIAYTRTPIIRGLLESGGINPLSITDNFLESESPAVFLDVREPYEDVVPPNDTFSKGIWINAHGDQPAYLIPRPTSDGEFDIMPICAHRPKVTAEIASGVRNFPEFPGVILRFDPRQGRYITVNKGTIGTRDSKTTEPFYRSSTRPPKGGFLPEYDRIAYQPPFAFDPESGLVSGNIDNAGGVAACIAAIIAFAKIAREHFHIDPAYFNIGWVFPDFEEGLPESADYFARSARRIIHQTGGRIKTPHTVYICDGHDTPNPPEAALYGAYVSRGRGAVSSPHNYFELDRIMGEVKRFGIETQRSESVTGASLSRSDDPAYFEKVTDIRPVGYGVRDPHHNDGLATANISSLVNLARVMTWIAVKSGSVW